MATDGGYISNEALRAIANRRTQTYHPPWRGSLADILSLVSNQQNDPTERVNHLQEPPEH